MLTFNKNIFGIGMVLLFLVLAPSVMGQTLISGSSFSGNSGTASFVNYGGSFNNYYSSDVGKYWPILKDPQSCEARQDILIQIDPAGCQPAVVRSDLLAEQNVPVFCQLSALQLNPAIDVKQIRNIRFSGNYPEGVVGVGFHPANAALRTTDTLFGSPIESNIGYVVVVLKRNPDEKNLPDNFEFTLGASIDYYAGNALGLGKNELLLQETSNDEWKTQRLKQSFLGGEYAVRLTDSDPNFIDLEVYRGDVLVDNLRVERSGSSRDYYLPGFYCQTAVRFSYTDLDSPDVIARLQVEDDIVDVYQGSRFLDGKCSVRKIIGDSVNGSIEFNCGNQNFGLSLVSKSLSIGDEVYVIGDGYKIIEDVLKIDSIDNGKRLYKLNDGQSISFDRVRPVSDDFLNEMKYGNNDKLFEQALGNYTYVFDNFGDAKSEFGSISYAQKALESAIDLSLKYNKEVTSAKLIADYLDAYPGSNRSNEFNQKLNNLYLVDSSLSGQIVNIDSGYKLIKLRGITIPTKKSSANVLWDGKVLKLYEGITNKSSSVGTITLTDIRDANTVVVDVSCQNKDDKTGGIKNLVIGDNTQTACGRSLRVQSTDIQNFAKVRIDPVTRTSGISNFTVGIGIEERAIELTPEKAKKQIAALDDSIKKFESISENLGNVVTGLKSACLATAGVLTVKNFFTGLSGESLARQEVMGGDNGWTHKCEDLLVGNGGPYSTLTECFNDKSEEIAADVDARALAIRTTNDAISKIEGNHITSTGGVFGGKTFDEDKAKVDLINELNSKYADVPLSQPVDGKKTVGELLNSVEPGSISYTQLRDVYTDSVVLKSGSSGSIVYQNSQSELQNIANSVIARDKVEGRISALGNVKTYALDSVKNRGNYFGDTVSGLKAEGINFGSAGLDDGEQAQVVVGGKKNYLVTFNQLDSGLQVEKVYNLDGKIVGSEIVGDERDKLVGSGDDRFRGDSIPGLFELRNSLTYNVPFASGETVVKYFETEPYKGMPAIVPFDYNRGFYAATRQSLPILGNSQAFESNGRPSSFYVCNVMSGGKIDFYSNGFGNDECVQFNYYTGQSFSNFPGLDEQATKALVSQAIRALEDASQGYGKKQVSIGGKVLQVGSAAAVVPGTQCQDFMSPEDCKLLFNVCDPVICPASRCNFGGAYQVSDVIQSGVVGSALLCLPNIKEGVYLPVCLTGIKAGLDGYVSILKSHRDCLQENIETGEYVGICDQITAVYTCEFFWRQAAPIANAVLPKVVEYAYTGGQGNTHGGGEYLTVQSAYQNAENSVNYFTQNYAVNSFDAFRARSVEEAGTTFCQAFLSAKGPTAFKTLVEPDSPPQFHSWFTEVPFTDATIPATSQYKVFYHIFAGADRGVSYSVYLKDPPSGGEYRNNEFVTVATGFVPRNEYATETRDFTAPKGYQQLCVRINDKEECGFKQVSSSFAVDYVTDALVSDQLNARNITSESECISGSVSPLAFLNPNLEEAAQEAVDPAVYNRGITRVCATSNPGIGTDSTRYLEVGNCGDERLKCWLDTKSISNSISTGNNALKDDTLENIQNTQKGLLENSGEVYSDSVMKSTIEGLVSKVETVNSNNYANISKEIDSVLSRSFWDYDMAKLWFLKGRLNDLLFKKAINSLQSAKVESAGKNEETIVVATPQQNTDVDVETNTQGNSQANDDAEAAKKFTLSSSYDKASSVENFILFNGGATDLFVKGSELRIKDGSRDSQVGQIGVDGTITILPQGLSKIGASLGDVARDRLDGSRIEGDKIVESSSQETITNTNNKFLKTDRDPTIGRVETNIPVYFLLDGVKTNLYAYNGFLYIERGPPSPLISSLPLKVGSVYLTNKIKIYDFEDNVNDPNKADGFKELDKLFWPGFADNLEGLDVNAFKEGVTFDISGDSYLISSSKFVKLENLDNYDLANGFFDEKTYFYKGDQKTDIYVLGNVLSSDSFTDVSNFGIFSNKVLSWNFQSDSINGPLVQNYIESVFGVGSFDIMESHSIEDFSKGVYIPN